MADDHFTLDVDLSSLRKAERWLGTLAKHTSTEGTNIRNAPDKLTDWTGPAATKIKGEMESLGGSVKGFHGKLTTLKTAVKTFADAVETFQDTTLVTYNRKWRDANSEAERKMNEADRAEDGRNKDGQTRGEVANGLRYTLQGIDWKYNEEKKALESKAKTLGTALGDSSPVPVPDSVAARFVARGGSGHNFTWKDAQGNFPPDLNANGRISGAGLSEDVDQQEAGENLAKQVNAGKMTPEEAAALAKGANPNSEAFRQGFINSLNADKLSQLHQNASRVGDVPGYEGWGELLSVIGKVLARGSRTEKQTTYPVDMSIYDAIVDAYTSTEDENNPHAKTQGYLRLSELIATGQGEPPTWDSNFLAEVTRRTIAYEREQVKKDKFWNWGNATMGGPAGSFAFVTDKGRDWYGGKLGAASKNPAWADPLTLYFEAMQNDTFASQQTLTNGTNTLDQDLSKYLYGRKAGHAGNYGWALSQMLQSATEPVGAGNPGDENYISASIVSDMVKNLANQPLPLNMEDGIVNILSNHAYAVNYAGSDRGGLVIDDNPNGVLTSQKIVMANLNDKDVKNLLTRVFGLDYHSNNIAEAKDPNSHNFPLYTKLALAMELAAKDDVTTAAKHPDSGGLLQTTVSSISTAQERTLQAFQDGLIGAGRDDDVAVKDARAALSFVTGLAKDAVPTSKLGKADVVAGPLLDRVEGLLVDTLIPQTEYEKAAVEDGDSQAYRRKLTGLKMVQWLSEAGVAPADANPVTWAKNNPEFNSFIKDGKMISPDVLYQNRNNVPEGQTAWNHFLEYYRSAGRPWLAEIDVDEQYKLGWLEAG